MYFKLAPISLDPAYKAKDVEKAKGTGTSMSLCVTMQVFDSGLIGEGVLHMLAAAKQKLLTKDAILVPAAATVFCQPLQMRIGQASTVSSLSPVVFPPQAFPSLAFCFCPFLSAFPSLAFDEPFLPSPLLLLMNPLCLPLSCLSYVPFPLCLSLSTVPIWSSFSCCYCQAMQ